jgi:hypothetical protein
MHVRRRERVDEQSDDREDLGQHDPGGVLRDRPRSSERRGDVRPVQQELAERQAEQGTRCDLLAMPLQRVIDLHVFGRSEKVGRGEPEPVRQPLRVPLRVRAEERGRRPRQ